MYGAGVAARHGCLGWFQRLHLLAGFGSRIPFVAVHSWGNAGSINSGVVPNTHEYQGSVDMPPVTRPRLTLELVRYTCVQHKMIYETWVKNSPFFFILS